MMMVRRRILRAALFVVGIFSWWVHSPLVHAQFLPSAWPQNTGAPVNSSPALGDLDGDGLVEIVVGSDNNKVYAWKPDGALMPGWPVATGDSVRSSPALADLDGDGRLDVIVGSFDNKVYAWNFHGSLLPGWPVVTGSVVYSSPAVGDIDGDQLPEVVVGSFDNKVYAWNADGTLVREWPKPTGLFVYSSPALADLDGDGMLDVVVGTDNNRVFAWKGSGAELDGWPTATEHVVPSSPAVGDLDQDGSLDVVVGSWDKVFAWNNRGERKPGWPVTAGHQIPSSPALADLNNDGRLETIIGCKDGRVYVWDAQGQPLPGWPTVTDAEISASPAVADLNGDGRLEILIGSKDQKVYIWDADGRLLPGWPKTTGGPISSSPAVADLDGDGTLEIVIGSKDQQVYVWSVPRTGPLTPQIVWQNFHGDPSHSGTYGFRAPVVAVAAPPLPPALPARETPSPDVRIIAAYPGATPQTPGVPHGAATPPPAMPVIHPPVAPREILDGYISDLVISDYEGASVTLTWTTPPGAYSPQAVYDIRYAVQPITEDTWDAALTYPSQMPPAAPGSREVQHLTNLNVPEDRPVDLVYLAVKIVDENRSFPLSNVVRFERQDTAPPAQIRDLNVTELNEALVELSWTAVGDDGNIGSAATYDLRYADVPLNDMTWVRATQIEGEPAPLPAGTEQRFQVPKPWTDREIFWGMKVIDDALNISDLSATAVWSPRDDIPPARIVDLRVTHLSGTTVTLTWTAPGNSLNVGKAARYDIRFSAVPMTDDADWLAATPAPNPPAPADAGTIQSYHLSGVPIGETVFVGIKTLDPSGNLSPLSNVIETAMDDLVPPAAVTDLTLDQVGKDWAKLSWTAVGDDEHEGAASAYILRYGGNVRVIRSWNEAIDVQDLPTPSRAGTQETATISGLNENTTYYVGLRVLDDQGNSSDISNMLRLKTLGYSTPATVTDLVIEELRPDSVTLNWTAPQDVGEESPRVMGYDLRCARAELTEETWESAAPLTHNLSPSPPDTLETLTVTHGVRDSAYFIAVKSVDSLGNVSALSNVVQVPEIDAIAPDPILDLVVEDAGQDWIRISWTAPGDDRQQGQASAIQIRVAPSLNQVKDWDHAIEIPNTILPALAGMKDAFTLTGLKPDALFFIALKSADEFGNTSELSNIVRANTKDAAPPAAITDLRASRIATGDILLEWTASGEDGMHGQAKTYDIRYAQEPVTPENWETLPVVSLVPRPAPAGARETVTLSDPLLPNTTYYAAIIVSDASGNPSPLSNVAQVLTGDTIAPNPITTLTAEAVDQTSVLLRWNSPGDDDLHDTPAIYDIRYAQSPLTEASWTQATTAGDSPIPSPQGEQERFLLSGLRPNSTYYIGIKAIDTDENLSPLSNLVHIYTSKDVVTDLQILEFSSQAVTLTWTAPGGVLSGEQRRYDLRYATTRITEETWDDAAPVEKILPASKPGHTENVVLTDVPMDEQLFFAVRMLQPQPEPDEGEPSLAGLSNVVELNRLDVVAPAIVSDFTVTDLGEVSEGIRSLAFTWQAPGDNNEDGVAAAYDLRYGILPPTEENWHTLTDIQGMPAPESAGAMQRAQVQVPYHEDTLYFALRTVDEAVNMSGISNIVAWAPEDFTPPAAVLDLTAARLPNGDIHVEWTAPGDNHDRGIAAFYDIRYAVKAADISQWDRAQVVPGEPLPDAAGARQDYLITGLDPDKSYYVALKTVDDAKNLSDLSNVVEVSRVLPQPITDLAYAGATDTTVTLSWTAPGDQRPGRRIVRYDLRFAEEHTTLEQWNRATKVRHSLVPGSAGTTEAITVEKLAPNSRYYFAIKSIDSQGEDSPLSNIAAAYTTDTIPPFPVNDVSLSHTTKDSITLSWTVQADDALHETPEYYELRYSLAPIDDATWAAALAAESPDQSLRAAAPGSLMQYTLDGLAENTRYYAAVRAIDSSGNVSGVSNVVAARTDDVTAPERITDLQAMFPTPTSVLLAWTCPADVTGSQAASDEQGTPALNGLSEDALIASYDLRYLEIPADGTSLDDAAWETAHNVLIPPAPLTPGVIQEYLVANLEPATTYTFAIKAIDRSGNISRLSNVAVETTLPDAFTSRSQTRAMSPSQGAGWHIVHGEQLADIQQDAWGTLTITPRHTARAFAAPPAATAVYPGADQRVAIRQGELTLHVKSAQDFLFCANVVVTADGEAPYTLCYTPSAYLVHQAHAPAEQGAPLPRKRIEHYVFYALDPSVTDNEWHELRVNLAQDLLAGTGFVYHEATRFAVRGVDMAFKELSMQGEVLTVIDDFEQGLPPLDTGWKLHFGTGTIQLARDAAPLTTESTPLSTGQPSNAYLDAKSDTGQALVVTYPRDASARVSDQPIFVANVKAQNDFKIILKIRAKDHGEYYLAYVPEPEFQSMAASGNYLYMPLNAASHPEQSRWRQIRINIADDVRQHHLEYDHTSWISFHGSEFSLDNVGFSTERLKTELK